MCDVRKAPGYTRVPGSPMRSAVLPFLFLLAAAVQASAQPFIYMATSGARTEDLVSPIAFTPRIAVLDAAAGTVVLNIAMPDCPPGDLAFRPDGARLFATCARTGSTSLLAIDPSTGQILQNVVYSGTVIGMRLAPDAARLYAINQTSQTVLVIDAATLAVTRQIAQAGA